MSIIINLLILTAFVAPLVAFICRLFEKWNLFEWLQIHGPNNELFLKMLDCRFCRTFWLTVIVCILFAPFEPLFLIVPFFSVLISIKLC